MGRRLAVARRALALSVMACMLTLAACARDKEKGGTARAPLPGALAKPLAQYSPDEFYTLVHALPFGGGIDRARRCRGASGCEVRGGRLTSARVDAVEGQDSLSASVVPPNGVVALRARNTGHYQESRYGMFPGADNEYYVVVLPPAGGRARWSLQQLVTTSGARTLTEVGTGAFFPCNHVSKGRYRANFYTCSEAHLAADSVMKMGLAFQEEVASPMWVRCTAGCCTVE